MSTPKAAKYIDVGPQNWKEIVPILEIVIQSGTPEGKREAMTHVRHLAELADLLVEIGPLLESMMLDRSKAGQFVHPTPENPDGFVFLDPLRNQADAWIKKVQQQHQKYKNRS